MSSHIGLGHVTRDLRIKDLLVKKYGKMNIVWCSAHPVYEYLVGRGERVVKVCRELYSMSPIAEQYIENKAVFRPQVLKSYLKILERNYKILDENVIWEDYDLIYADEFWELVIAENFRHLDRLLFATDFVFKRYEFDPLENIISYVLNRYFAKKFRDFKHKIYIGLLDEIPNQKISLIYGEYMSRWIDRNFIVVGKIPSVNQVYRESDPKFFRERLGINPEDKVITVLLGGTRTRSEALLDKICRVWRDIKKEFRGRLLIILGPRTKYSCSDEDVDVYSMVYEVGDYLALSDVVISRAGRTTVTDLEYLGVPSIVIPIKGHFEQKWIAKISSSKYKFIESLSEDFNSITFANKIKKLINMKRSKTKIFEFMGAENMVNYIAHMVH